MIHDLHYVTDVLDPKTIEPGIGTNEICTCIGRFAPIMRVGDRRKLMIVTYRIHRSQPVKVVFYVEGNMRPDSVEIQFIPHPVFSSQSAGSVELTEIY